MMGRSKDLTFAVEPKNDRLILPTEDPAVEPSEGRCHPVSDLGHEHDVQGHS